jgi:prophage regulatory protein
MTETNRPKLLSIAEVSEITKYRKSSIYNKVRLGEFPRPISLGERSIAWLESDIYDWIEERIRFTRDKNATEKTDA